MTPKRHMTPEQMAQVEAALDEYDAEKAKNGRRRTQVSVFSPDEFRERVAAKRGVPVESLPSYREPVSVVSIEDFAAIDEAGAASLVGDADEALIPDGGDVMFYGDGGAGKTTLSVDLACHLAAGDPWIGITIPKPRRALLVENEGPRALFRRKLRRKLDGWAGSPIEGRVMVMEAPWASVSFADQAGRDKLSAAIREHEIDVVIVGPVSRSGMNEAGTLQDIASFMALIADVRTTSGRPVTVILVHHENKGGKVSGAWEGAGDTLFHVTGQGHGRTRLYIQKARWASSHHATTLNLVWSDGDGYAVEDQPELTDDDVAEKIVAVITAEPGTNWTNVEESTPGMARKRRRDARDRLLKAGTIVNIAKVDGVESWLDECPERKQSRLYLAEDPTIQHLRPSSGADGAQTAPGLGAEHRSASAPCAPPLRGRRGVGADPHPLEDGGW